MNDEDIDTIVKKPKKVFHILHRCSCCSHTKLTAPVSLYITGTFESYDAYMCIDCTENLKKTAFKDSISR